ncbi:formate C-acetyltransferase [Sporobacter termitidis DSM 10068]|uniref:Formate C-acetyltransferase n=1 Tax=Sporobacter termitidis DSM 10068 TaxID=1123282 RepID=A0A1M5YLI3_9FIRM|nr:pyruvate formate lyase family protein [Sporobacter termitidis]SHI12937.1 formate C-acetyltransferase [Sporobacter termitidis DSM 10068]
MYEFRPATDRIWHLRELIRDRVLRIDAERAVLWTEASKKYENVVPIIKRPLSLYELCKNMTILFEDFEIIIGNKSPYFFGSPQYPEWIGQGWFLEPIKNGEWPLKDGMYYNPEGEQVRLSISQEDYEALLSIQDYWKDRRVTTVADAWQPDGFDELKRLNVSSYADGGMGMTCLSPGHLIAGYDKIIGKGYAAIRREAQDWLDAHRGDLMGEDMNKYMFYKSATIACDAAILLVKRYAQACLDKAAACADDKRKAELLKMGDSLMWISENPARSFWEAVQGIMMYQILINLETRIPSPALGRFDQWTWPYLKRDLESGALTMDEAQEIVDAFFLKANCYYNAGPDKLVKTTGIGNTYQHTTIGGVDPSTGEDATNPITYMVLETVGRLKLHDPTISLRINKNSPDRLWDCALETSRLVGGLPLFQNDEVIIPALQAELGFELYDARNYGIIGCQEIVGCGCDFPAPNGIYPPHASVWWGSIFDMAINNGRNPFNGEQASLKTGYLYEMSSIEEVREAVARMGRYIMKLFISANNYAEYISPYYSTQPALSISMTGCMEKGLDAVMGGCKYNSYGGTATGLATLGDALTTIKYMCFDKKKCTTRALYDAVMANWEGCEPLRQQILNEVPHYGNADPYADMEVKWCVDLYYDICQELYSVRSKKYKSGLYGASDHVAQGYLTWATPDGRKLGEPIADAMSPCQSRDSNGPTAVFVSACCFDHHHYLGGIALNLRMHPTVLSRGDGIAKLRDMTKAYFENGGMEVQYNVVDTATLRQAQADPTKYRDLVVRIAGYSAYFVELGHDLQNDIIARHENRL